MATTNIELDIENITGVADANDQFVISAQKYVASSIPKDLLWFASTAATITSSSGIDIQTADSILSVDRNGYPSYKVPFSMSKWIDDSTSLHNATALHPKHYDKGGKIYIKPDPDGSNTGTVQYVDYSQIDDDCDLRNAVVFHASAKEFTQLATDGLPSWTSPSAPIPPSSPNFGSDLSISSSPPVVPTITASTVDTSGWTSPTYTKPVLALTSNPSITDLTISAVLPVPPSVPSFDTGDISVSASLPTYSKPVLSLSTLSSISDLSISLSPPVPPVIAATTSNLTTWDGSSSGGIVVDSELLSSAPVYTSPVLESRTAFTDYTSGLSELDPGVLSISLTSPVPPSSPSFTTPDVSSVTVSNVGVPPTYTSPTITIGGVAWATEYPDSEVDLATALAAIVTNVDLANAVIGAPPTSPVTPTGPSFSTPGISTTTLSNLGVPPTYTAPNIPSTAGGGTATDELTDMVDSDWTTLDFDFDGENIDFATWFQTAGALIQDEEDVELAGAQLQKIQTYISAYQAAMQNQLNVFNDSNAEYQARLQEGIQQAQINAQEAQQEANLLLQKEQQEYASTLQRYGAEVQNYQAEIGAMTAKSQGYLQAAQGYANEVKARLSATQVKISEYQIRVQDALNEFNEANAEYQAKLQEAIQQAQINAQEAQQEANLKLQKEQQEYGSKLQKFQAEVGNYQADVSKEVQEYTQKLAQYQVELTTSLQSWQKEENDKVARYQSEVQNNLNEFNEDTAEYQATLQIALKNADLSSAGDGLMIQKFSSELSSYQQQVNKDIQQFTNNFQKNIQVYQAENQAKLAEYQANIQNELNEFNKEQTVFQNELQEKIQESTNQQTKDSQEYSSKLQKYSSEVQAYQQDVNKQIQEYTINEVQKELAIWNTNIQSDLQTYSSDMQNELNKFNKESQIYQSEVQASIQDAQLESAEEGQKIQKYSAELNSYQQDINKEVQDFVNTLNKEVQEHQGKIALYTADIQKYQSDLAEKTQESNVSTQSVQYYEKQADKYYSWALSEVQQYIQNNSKIINKTIAAQQQAAQQ